MSFHFKLNFFIVSSSRNTNSKLRRGRALPLSVLHGGFVLFLGVCVSAPEDKPMAAKRLLSVGASLQCVDQTEPLLTM